MAQLIQIATDPLIAGILYTAEHDPSADYVEYNFSEAQLKAMQCEYATGALAEAIHEWLVRKGAYLQEEQEE